MSILKWLIGLVVVLAIVFFAGGSLLPRDVTVARSVEINADAAAVFPHLNSLKATGEWSPWLDRDPNVQLSYSGPEEGVGAKLEWTSEHPQVGTGSQEIKASVVNERVETMLDFGEMGLAKAEFLLSGSAGVTEVTWTLETDMGSNPVGCWMGLMMDRMVGSDCETGLQNLKKLVESGS